MAYNSTIINKKKNLSCGHYDYNFSRGRCKQCATIQDTQKRISESIISEDESLPELISEADALFSKYIRLKYSDKDGNVSCYTCGNKMRWQDSQCGHYISRACLYLRFDERNCRVQDEHCNCVKHGNLAVFGKNLELEFPNVTEILYEESKLIYKPTRDELRSLISELNLKIKQLK